MVEPMSSEGKRWTIFKRAGDPVDTDEIAGPDTGEWITVVPASEVERQAGLHRAAQDALKRAWDEIPHRSESDQRLPDEIRALVAEIERLTTLLLEEKRRCTNIESLLRGEGEGDLPTYEAWAMARDGLVEIDRALSDGGDEPSEWSEGKRRKGVISTWLRLMKSWLRLMKWWVS